MVNKKKITLSIFFSLFEGYPASQNDVEVAEDCFQVSKFFN